MSEEKSRSNWSANDACLLVQLYEPFHGLISGTVRTPNIGRSRETAWKKIFDSFSSSGPDEVRTERQLRDKISNIKESARKHGSAVHFNETGGGPPPPVVPAYILKMYELQGGNGNAGLVGIGSLMKRSKHLVWQNTLGIADPLVVSCWSLVRWADLLVVHSLLLQKLKRLPHLELQRDIGIVLLISKRFSAAPSA